MWTSPTSRYSYQVPTVVTAAPPSRFSRTELTQIAIAFSVLTFDFWILYSGITGTSVAFGRALPGHSELLLAVPSALLIAATGFLSHEMAHKFSAQRMGLWAEFRMSLQWLLLSMFSALIGFLFAAPGATYVRGAGTKVEWGLTSLSGPAVNLAWVGVFLGLAYLPFHYPGYVYWGGVFGIVALVNTWFALFNLIPFGPLDGKKVLNWNAGIWAGALVGAIALFIFTAFFLR